MENRHLRSILLFSLCLSLLLVRPCAALTAAITDIRFWSATDHTRIVLDLTEPVQYESTSKESPPQFHLELRGVFIRTPKREIKVKDPFLTEIRLSDSGKNKAKLILYQTKPLSTHVFMLKPYQEKTYRLVIDLVDVAQERKEQEERQRQKQIAPRGTKIVVIDPGHGGEDPGAIGPGKTMEKDIVLKVGEKVVHSLSQKKEVKGFLTRKGDYFVELQDRKRIAGDYKADLFVSLHTDASFNTYARGSSVYCLSLSGATDQAAKTLADKENLSNILGGVSARPPSISEDRDRDEILLDLTQNHSLRESFRFAESVLQDIKAVNGLKYPSYRQANFVVLRAPNIPSVLLEIAYVTNKEDERLLRQTAFQERVAGTLTTSIMRYFKEAAE